MCVHIMLLLNILFPYGKYGLDFPATENISLAENRKAGYDEAVKLLENPYIGTSDPADPSDPSNPNKPDGIKRQCYFNAISPF